MNLLLSYRYKLKPNKEQSQKMAKWLDLLRATYNWCLKDRIDGWHQKYLIGEYYDRQTHIQTAPLSGSLVKVTQLDNPWKVTVSKSKKAGEKAKSPKRTPSLMQDANLQDLKASRPWYDKIESGVLQLIPIRVNEALNKFFDGAGFSKFKCRHGFKSFSYKPKRVKVKGSKIYFPKIGWIRFHNSRPIPEGFEIKTVTLRQAVSELYDEVK